MTSLPKTFIGYSSDLPPATLDLNFAGNKSLTDNITSTNLVTFTRASSGTYVAANGFITQAVVNVLLWSESFEQSVWTKAACSVSANQTNSPFGELTADKLIESNTNAEHLLYFYRNGSNERMTLSVYAKAAERTRIRIGFSNFVNESLGAVYDLSNGTVVQTQPSGTDYTSPTSSIETIGNGWYRCVYTVTKNAVSTLNIPFVSPVIGTSGSYLGDGTSGIYIWGAQLETGSTANEYIRTTSVINSAPRFDHNPVTGESLGLLVEEQRTNLLLSSELIGGTSWTNQNSLTVVTNSTDVTDPAGGTTASKLTAGSTTSQTLQSAILTTTQYAGSVYLRTQSGTANVTLYVFLQVSPFTLIGTTSATVTTAWQRLSLVTSTATAASYNLGLQITTNGATVYAWGAQLEVGAFPTSYIPTTTATVTRTADLASITGTNFSSWYRQDEGTVFAEGAPGTIASGAFPRLLQISNSDSTSRIILQRYGSNTPRFTVVDSSVTQAAFDATGTWLPATNGKMALAVKLNDFAGTFAGSAPNTDTSGSLPSLTQLAIGAASDGTQYNNGTIRRITYWPTRLPNTSLQEMTK